MLIKIDENIKVAFKDIEMQNNSSNCGIKNFCSIMIICGRNSVVECNLPKVDVAGSSPVSRFLNYLGQLLYVF